MEFALTLLFLCLPLVLTSEVALQEFTTGNNLFASDVYSELVKKASENFLVSPFSVETILALTQFGAKEATGEEIRTALHLPNQENIKKAITSLQTVYASNPFYVLKSANKIYLEPGFEVQDSFNQIATELFASEVENIDFTQNEAAARINQWVESQTDGKIKDILSSNDLSKDPKAVLINALYFKSNWSNPFSASGTYLDNFYKSEFETLTVDTMHNFRTLLNYVENPELDAKFVELPFKNPSITLTIALPNKKFGLGDLEKNIDKVLQRQSLVETLINIALPKFKIESQLDFKEVLRQLGVKTVFISGEADLSGVAGLKGELTIDQIVQKTYMDVAENGVEAAAASGALASTMIGDLRTPEEFKVDHPFIFYIKVNDLIIFAGRVVDPSRSN